MNKKSRTIILVIICVIIITSISLIAFGEPYSKAGEAGGAYNESKNLIDDVVVASYKDIEITRSSIEFFRNTEDMQLGGANHTEAMTDEEIVEIIVLRSILKEEADKKGLTATQAQVDEMLSDIKGSYEQFPEVKAMIDDFCSGANITLDEHWKNLATVAPATITRNNIKSEFRKDYCNDNGLDMDTLSEENWKKIEAAYSDYCNKLLAAHKSEIIFETSEIKSPSQEGIALP